MSTSLARPLPYQAPLRTITDRQQGSALQQVGFYLLLIFLFLVYSRIIDYLFSKLHLPLIISCLVLLLAFATGGVQRALSTRAGVLLTAFTAWIMMTLPFSFWRGGSVAVFKELWLKSFVIFILVAGLIRTLDQCRKAMYTIAYAVLVVTMMCFYFRTTDANGRLALRSGLLGNANDLAQILLMGLPFWILMAMNVSRLPFRRLIAGFCMVPIGIAILATGSRSAIIAIIALIAVTFWKLSVANKMKMAVAGLALGGMALMFMPGQLKQRYRTIFEQTTTMQVGMVEVSAIESTEQRIYLFKQSIRLTLLHPIWGVGVGNFQPAAAAMAGDDGENPAWRETHNSYTQISSETGIPGFLLYIGALLVCRRSVTSVAKHGRQHRELAPIFSLAYCLMLSLMSLSVLAIFSSIAYNIYFPTLAGLSVAFSRCAREEIRARGLDKEASASALRVAPALSWPQPRIPVPDKHVWNRGLRNHQTTRRAGIGSGAHDGDNPAPRPR